MQVVGLLGILRLDLECLLERLRADQLLKSFGCLFKPRFRVVDELGGDRLEAFVQLAIRANCRIKIVFANLLELLARLNGPCGGGPPAGPVQLSSFWMLTT